SPLRRQTAAGRLPRSLSSSAMDGRWEPIVAAPRTLSALDVYVNGSYASAMSQGLLDTDRGGAKASVRTWTIAELAREFAVTPRAIRFYEDGGLIAPARQGTNRIYSAGDRARLGWILRGKRLGFSLGEIRELLDLYHADRSGVQQLRGVLRKSREHIA